MYLLFAVSKVCGKRDCFIMSLRDVMTQSLRAEVGGSIRYIDIDCQDKVK